MFPAAASLFIFSFSVAFCTHGPSVSYTQHCILFLGGENQGVNSVVGSDKHIKDHRILGVDRVSFSQTEWPLYLIAVWSCLRAAKAQGAV